MFRADHVVSKQDVMCSAGSFCPMSEIGLTAPGKDLHWCLLAIFGEKHGLIWSSSVATTILAITGLMVNNWVNHEVSYAFTALFFMSDLQ